MSAKRDAAYYRRRLKAEHPPIYADLRAGRFKSVRQASLAAGFIKPPTRVGALIREWKKASPRHRQQFLDWLRSAKVGFKKAVPPSITYVDGRLLPAAIAFLRKHTADAVITPGRVMLEMGLSRYDWTLAHALAGGHLRPEVVEALKVWMPAKGYK
jgi:hypothetical protein